MRTLTTLFQTILNMSVAASIVAAAIMVVRLPLKKAPKIFSYALWGFVLIRLVMPFSFTSRVSVLSVASPEVSEGRVQFVVPSGNQAQNSIPGPIIHTGETAVNPSGFQTNGSAASQNSNAQSGMTVGAHNSASGNASEPLDELSGGEALISPLTPISPLLQLASVIWVVGMIGYAGLLIINSLTLRHRLRYAMRVKQNIYECEAITSPFIYGLFHPKIYLPMDLDLRQRKYVLTHERIHLRRYDYVFKMIGSLVLMFHWFNPILWYSYILMSKDMEMACDEAVVRRLGQNGRINYGMTLLQFASRPTITALSFSESNTKLRIKNILNYKKPTFWVLAAGIAACLLLAVPLLSNPAFGKDQRQINELLNQAAEAQIASVDMVVNLNEPYNQYQWSIIPMIDQNLIIVSGEQNLQRRVAIAYDLSKTEVIAADLKVSGWKAEQCADLADLLYQLYVDNYVISEAFNNVNLALGDHLTSIDYCTVFESLGPIRLSYGSNSDQLVIEFTKVGQTEGGQFVYDKNLDRLFVNTSANQLNLPEDFWKEFAAMVRLYDEQKVVQNSTCAVLEDGRFSCPGYFTSLPQEASSVAPLLAWKQDYDISEDYDVIGWDLTDNETADRTRIPVLAIAPGRISEVGEDEQGRRYIRMDHPELGISTFYGGLNDKVYRIAEEEIGYYGQLLGYLSTEDLPEDQRPALHFAVLSEGQTVNELTPYLQYAMASEIRMNVFEIQDYTFEINEEKLAQIDRLVAESNAYAEYNSRMPLVDRSYAQQSGVSITAQPTDFPTLNITQELGTNKLYIDRDYRIDEIYRNVIPGVEGNFVITVNLDRSPTLGEHTSYECNAYFPELSVWLNTTYNPQTQQYSTVDMNIEDEALIEATYAMFDELNDRIRRTDERALDLAAQIIQVITDEQPAEFNLEPLASMFAE